MAANIIGSTFASLVVDYYEKKKLETAEIQNDLLKFGKKAVIPKGNNDTIHWNRIELYTLAQTVTDGTDLTSGQTPTVTEVKGKLALYGDFISVSPYGDEIRIISIIDDAYDQFILQAARTANRKLMTTLVNGDTTTGNNFTAWKAMYAGNANSYAEMVAGGVNKLTNKDIQKAVAYLRKQKAREPITCLMNAWGHEDLMTNDDEFRGLIKNQALSTLTMDRLPYWAGAKMGWQDDPWRTDLSTVNNGAAATYSTTGQVFVTFIFGADSFGTVQLMGRTGLKPKFKVQDISKIGVEVTIGYFIPYKGGALNNTWGVALFHVASGDISMASIT